MIRNFLFSSVTAFSLLSLAACGDSGGTTTTGATETGTGTTDSSTSGTTGSTTNNPTTGGTGTDSGGQTTTGTTNNPTTSTTTPDTTSTTTPDTTSTTDPGTTGTTDPGTTGTTGNLDPVESCKMMADPQTECSDCVCENCLMELQACEADEGCKAIRMCAEETGCTGFDCLQLCGDVINMYGGIGGQSAMLGLDVSGCLDDNMCPC